MPISRRQLDALKQRDQDALRRLAETNTRRLYRAARGMGLTGDEAGDVVQDVFVTFLGTLDRFEGRASVETWLYGILLRKVQERRRAQRRDRRHDAIDETWEERFDAEGRWTQSVPTPETVLDAREIASAVRACLEALPDRHRDVFVLRHVEELTAAEVGRLLDLTVSNVGVILHRARLRIRRCLDRRGLAPPPR